MILPWWMRKSKKLCKKLVILIPLSLGKKHWIMADIRPLRNLVIFDSTNEDRTDELRSFKNFLIESGILDPPISCRMAKSKPTQTNNKDSGVFVSIYAGNRREQKIH